MNHTATLLFIGFLSTVHLVGQGFPSRSTGGVKGIPPIAILNALDVNKDGKLSKSEIQNATAALKKLDRNKDGKLSAQEMGWPPTMRIERNGRNAGANTAPFGRRGGMRNSNQKIRPDPDQLEK